MRRAALFLALSLAAGVAHAGDLSCEIHSDYDVTIDDDRVSFSRAESAPTKIDLEDGVLTIDGRRAVLSKKDQERLARVLRETRVLAPEVGAIALDAVDIAFLAMSEVAVGLLDESDDTLANLAEARKRIEADLRATPPGAFDDRRHADLVGEAIAELVPALVADVVKAALVAAFTGDTAKAEALEARAAKIEREVERRIEPRARALEKRARALCERMAEIDAIEEDLDYRLPDGRRLELLRSGPE